MTDNDDLELNSQTENENDTGSETQPQPYIHEPLYKELLQSYQNADWDQCAALLDQLLESYPENTSLIEFQREITVRNILQNNNTKVEQKEQQEKTKKRIIQGSIILTVAVVLFFALRFVVKSIENNQIAAQATQTATAIEQYLDSNYENAENFRTSGRWSSAYNLYLLVSETDPNYKDVEAKLAEAKEMMELDEKYQEGITLSDNGEYEQALEIFYEVSAQSPHYKSVDLHISNAENILEIARLLEASKTAFENEDWAGVIENYEAIMEIDNAADVSSIDEERLLSYLQLVKEIADNPNATLADVERAEAYYKIALTISPQSKEHAQLISDLKLFLSKLFATKYYVFAKDLLATEGYSIPVCNEALRLLNLANKYGPSDVITKEIASLTLFIDSFNNFMSKSWEEAIDGLKQILSDEENYADGFAKYLLYEAYTIRGDIFFTYADYTNALSDYEAAAIIAYGNESENDLQAFEIEIKIAKALRRLQRAPEAAEYYYNAFENINFAGRISGNQDLLNTLEDAKNAYLSSNYWTAMDLYDLVLGQPDVLYEVEVLTVNQGDSLPQIAFEYGTTLNTIYEFNQIGDIMQIKSSMELNIPIIPPEQE